MEISWPLRQILLNPAKFIKNKVFPQEGVKLGPEETFVFHSDSTSLESQAGI